MMSRLSGAVGALRGYQEGRLNDQDLKLKLMDTLQSLRQYEEVTLPQSQAIVGLTEAQRREYETRLPGVKAEATKATTDLEDYLGIREKMMSLLGGREGYLGKPAETKIADWDKLFMQSQADKRKAEQQAKPDYAEAIATQERREAELSAKVAERRIKMLESAISPEEEQRFIESLTYRYPLRKALLDIQSAKNQNERDAIKLKISKDFDYDLAQLDKDLKQLEYDNAKRIYDDQVELLNLLKSKPEYKKLYEDFRLAPIKEAIARANLLQAQGRNAEANAIMQEAISGSKIFKERPELMVPSYVSYLSIKSDRFRNVLQAYGALMKTAGTSPNAMSVTNEGELITNDRAFYNGLTLALLAMSDEGNIKIPWRPAGTEDTLKNTKEFKQRNLALANELLAVGTAGTGVTFQVDVLTPQVGNKQPKLTLTKTTTTPAVDAQATILQNALNQLLQRDIVDLLEEEGFADIEKQLEEARGRISGEPTTTTEQMKMEFPTITKEEQKLMKQTGEWQQLEQGGLYDYWLKQRGTTKNPQQDLGGLR